MAYYSDLCIHDWYVTDKLFFAALNSPQGDAPEILWHHPLQRGSLCTVSWTGWRTNGLRLDGPFMCSKCLPTKKNTVCLVSLDSMVVWCECVRKYEDGKEVLPYQSKASKVWHFLFQGRSPHNLHPICSPSNVITHLSGPIKRNDVVGHLVLFLLMSLFFHIW